MTQQVQSFPMTQPVRLPCPYVRSGLPVNPCPTTRPHIRFRWTEHPGLNCETLHYVPRGPTTAPHTSMLLCAVVCQFHPAHNDTQYHVNVMSRAQKLTRQRSNYHIATLWTRQVRAFVHGVVVVIHALRSCPETLISTSGALCRDSGLYMRCDVLRWCMRISVVGVNLWCVFLCWPCNETCPKRFRNFQHC